MMWIIVGLLLVALSLTVLRMVLGPTMVDRVLSVHLFGTMIVLLIVLLCYLLNDYAYLDTALVYGLINFIATIGLLRYIKAGQPHE